jgi:anti-anti-sigma factor
MTTQHAVSGNDRDLESVADHDALRQQSSVRATRRLVVVITGGVDLASADDAARALETARREQPGDLTVDLSGVDFIDASGLKPLLDAHRALSDEGRNLALRAPSAAVLRLLQITRLEHVFPRSTDD